MEYLGINGFLVSVLQILNIAELGMGSAILYSMYKPMAERNIASVNSLLNLYRRIYKALGICLLLVGLALIPVFPHLVREGCPADVNIYIVYLIQLSDTVVGYLAYAYWNAVLQADQETGKNYKISVVADSMMYLIQMVVICKSHNYYLYIMWLPLKTLISNIVRAIYVRRRYPCIRCEGNVDRAYLKEFYRRVFAMALSKVRIALRGAIDSIAVSANMGLVALAKYQNYHQIMIIPDLMVSVVKGAVLPSLGVNVATRSREDNYHVFEVYTFINNWVSTWCTTCALCMIQNFMYLWAGMENVLTDSVVVLLCIYFYLCCISENALMIREVSGVWWIGKWGAVVETILNLLLNLIFVRFWGIQGVVAATIISMVCVNLPVEYMSIFKGYFKIGAKRYFLRQISYLGKSLLICTVTWQVCRMLPIGSLKTLMLECVICIILPNVIYIITHFYDKEFKEVFQKVFSVINAKK